MNKNLKRVLWISDYFPRPHDMTTGVWALQTVLAIHKLGVEVVVLTPTPYIPKWLTVTPNLKEWAHMPYNSEIKHLPVYYPRCPHYPRLLIRKYFYSFLPFFESSLVWHSCKETISRILEKYPFQVVHANFVFPSGYLGFKIKKEYGIPLVVHERSSSRLNMALNRRLSRNIYTRVMNEADSIITANDDMVNTIKRIAPLKKINVITSAANTEISNNLTQQKPERYKGKKIVLAVGTLTERKGHEYLIRAINEVKDEFPEIYCIIIGRKREGKYLDKIKKLINDLRLHEYVELYGLRPHDEVLSTMSWSDLFVLPSWNEPFGTAYCEAMTFCKPIIACKGEGISKVVEHGVQGLLVKKRDVKSLSDAIKKLLMDENLTSSLGKQARLLSEKKLNYRFIASQIIDIYKKIIYLN